VLPVKFIYTICSSIVQAHSVKDPVYCLHFNAHDDVKDFMIESWDSALKDIGTAID
jgi:hypothetical protein